MTTTFGSLRADTRGVAYARHALFSVVGTGARPEGPDFAADTGWWVDQDIYEHRIVPYPAKALPMNGSADAGEQALVDQINAWTGTFGIVDYSQGSICGGRVRNRLRHGDLQHRYADFIGSASYGNPMRPAGNYVGNTDPGGEGIAPDRETNVEPYCINLAAKGDLYTTCPFGAPGEWERAIFNAVFSKFTGTDSLVEQIGEFMANPLGEGYAAFRATINGGMFIAQNPPTAPHVQYHMRLVPGTNVTYQQYAIAHMNRVGAATPAHN